MASDNSPLPTLLDLAKKFGFKVGIEDPPFLIHKTKKNQRLWDARIAVAGEDLPTITGAGNGPSQRLAMQDGAYEILTEIAKLQTDPPTPLILAAREYIARTPSYDPYQPMFSALNLPKPLSRGVESIMEQFRQGEDPLNLLHKAQVKFRLNVRYNLHWDAEPCTCLLTVDHEKWKDLFFVEGIGTPGTPENKRENDAKRAAAKLLFEDPGFAKKLSATAIQSKDVLDL